MIIIYKENEWSKTMKTTTIPSISNPLIIYSLYILIIFINSIIVDIENSRREIFSTILEGSVGIN